MPEAEDALPELLRSLAGSTVAFVPGEGGVEDAVAALAFRSLCGRCGVEIAPGGAPAPDNTIVFGSLAAAAAMPGRGGIVLPSQLDGPEALEPALRAALTLVLPDPAALRLAEFQGVPAERRLLGRDMAHHLDLDGFAAPGEGRGTLRLGFGAVPAGEGDAVALRLSGAGGRWGSPDECRSAVGGLLALLGRYAEVVTDSGTVVILAARLGRAAVLRDAPPAPEVAADAAARRGARAAAQALEAATVEAAELRLRLDAGFAAAVAAAERGAEDCRLVPASLHGRRMREHEAAGAALRARAEAEGTALRARAEAAEARLAAAETRARAEADAAGALEASLAARTEQALGLQDALDRAEMRLRIAETRVAPMQTALEDRDAALEDGRQARAQLQRVASSLSWRLTRPLRVATRALARVPGARRA